jgi:hypothetical protein
MWIDSLTVPQESLGCVTMPSSRICTEVFVRPEYLWFNGIELSRKGGWILETPRVLSLLAQYYYSRGIPDSKIWWVMRFGEMHTTIECH